MPPPFMDRRWWVTLNVSIGVYMSTLDASVVNISLPTITQNLNTHLNAVAWVVMAYLIVITGCLLLMGRLTDLFGQRKVYLWGFTTFTLGSAFCGFSPTISVLVASRMLQGLGASALMASGPAILTTAFPEEKRGQALGIIGSVVSAGFLTGPILGGFLVEHLGWRSVFFVNLPVGALGVFLSSRILKRSKSTKQGQLDLAGAFLFFASIAFFLLFLNQLGQRSSRVTWVWLALSFLCLGFLIILELRTPFPLVDLRLFRRRLFVSSLGTSLLAFWMNSAHIFVIPFFLQGIMNFSPSRVGMLIFPVSLAVMVVAPLGGRLSDRAGTRIPATMGLMLTSFAILSFVFLEPASRDYQILWRQLLLGIGIGLFNPANNSAIIGSLPKKKVGLASSFLALGRNLGLVIGVAFAEMVIAFRTTTAASGTTVSAPSIGSIQDVWKLAFAIGVTATLISWVRQKPSKSSEEK